MSVPTDEGRRSAGGGVTRPARRRRVVGAVVVVLVAALVVLVVVLSNSNSNSNSNGDNPDPAAAGAADGTTASPTTASAATSTAPATAAPATATPTAVPAVNAGAAVGPTGGGDATPSALPAVALDAPAAIGNGVVATLPGIEAIEGEASGPGNVNGPALRVTVRIQNGTDQAISLDGVATNLYYGADRTPASPLDDASEQPFTGTLGAGEAAQAVYVFNVPTDVRNAVTVEVGYAAGAPLLLFTGPVG